MHSTLAPKQSDDPHDILVVAPDAVRVVPAEDQISELLHEAATRFRSDPQPHAGSNFPAGPLVRPVDTTFRPAAVNVPVPGRGWSKVRRAARAGVALLLAACIGVAAVAWRAYGDTAKKQIAKMTTQLALIVLPSEPSQPAAPPAAPAVQADAVNAAPAQPAVSAQPADGVAPTAAAPSTASDSAPSRLWWARDLASVGQEVEQLKASIEQLKASQQQILRDVARASQAKMSEPGPRPRKPVPPLRSAAAPARAPMPAFPPRQAAATSILPPAAAPYVPRQPQPLPPTTAEPRAESDLASAPRPPMPLR
jgi:hypothetical protein